MELYTDADLKAAKKTFTARAVVQAVILLATAGLLALALVKRWQIAAVAFTAVGGCLFYAFMSLKLMPWYHYVKYLADIGHGRSRETDCWFVSLADEPRASDGVMFREFLVRIGDSDDDERLFFFDDDKTPPALAPGAKLHITSFGNYITKLRTV